MAIRSFFFAPLFLTVLILSLSIIASVNIVTAQTPAVTMDTSNSNGIVPTDRVDIAKDIKKFMSSVWETTRKGVRGLGERPAVAGEKADKYLDVGEETRGKTDIYISKRVTTEPRRVDSSLYRITPRGITEPRVRPIDSSDYIITPDGMEKPRVRPIDSSDYIITPDGMVAPRPKDIKALEYITISEYRVRTPTYTGVKTSDYTTLSEYKARMPKTTRVTPSRVSGRPTGAGMGKEYLTVHEYRALHPSMKEISPAGARVSGVTPTVRTMDIGLPAVDIKASISKAMAEAMDFAKDNHWIVYLAILIISALISRSGGWQIGIVSAMALSIMSAVMGLMEGYLVFVILIACAGLFAVSVGKAT